MESLCRQYWYPLYAFIRRQGRGHHEAEDCTQGFLTHLLATHGIARARPEGGRFRSFLLIALRNFLTNEWHRTQAIKRGGGLTPLPIEFETAEQRFSLEPVDPGLNPEQIYDRNWAQSMIDQAVAELRAEYGQSGRGELFSTLESIVWHNSDGDSHAELAQRLHMGTHAFTVALQRLRRRLGERLRLNVAQTVASESEVEAELHHLIAAVSRP
ncbi:MAG: sigma-70 family RNA polymerase sigma factor [Opitutae bacterium]